MSSFKVGEYGLGQSYPKSFRVWYSMRERCLNKNSAAYARYGGRGISICERWHNFKNFVEDMGERPSGKSIDRFPNNDGDYEPANCRWATAKEQANNRRPGTPPKDLSGQKFNKLTAVSVAGRYEKTGEVLWNCKCECGAETIVKKSALEFGRTKSCGCSRWRVNQLAKRASATLCDWRPAKERVT